jgi:hypothetical protein
VGCDILYANQHCSLKGTQVKDAVVSELTACKGKYYQGGQKLHHLRDDDKRECGAPEIVVRVLADRLI